MFTIQRIVRIQQLMAIYVLLLEISPSVVQPFSPFPSCQRQRHASFSHQLHSTVAFSSSSSSYNHTEESSPAPVYISIGPPCSGKTEALRHMLLQDGYDPDLVFGEKQEIQVSSDSAYYRIPLEGFLFPNSTYLKGVSEEVLIGSTTVQERLLDPTFEASDEELRLVLLRVAGRISEEEFQHGIWEVGTNSGSLHNIGRNQFYQEYLPVAVEQVVVQAVSEVICRMEFMQQDENETMEELPYKEDATNSGKRNVAKCNYKSNTTTATQQPHLLSARALISTPHVDLFVPQRVMNHIPQASRQLLDYVKNPENRQIPIFWSNTNSRPKEYVAALEAAEQSERPVRFCAWKVQWEVTPTELLRRNVARFRQTGRYIPAGAVHATQGRVERLVSGAKSLVSQNLEKSQEGYDLETAFCELAGFRRDVLTGLVTQVGPPQKHRHYGSKRYNNNNSKRRRTYYSGTDSNSKKKTSTTKQSNSVQQEARAKRRQEREIQRQKREDLRSYIQKTIGSRKGQS